MIFCAIESINLELQAVCDHPLPLNTVFSSSFKLLGMETLSGLRSSGCGGHGIMSLSCKMSFLMCIPHHIFGSHYIQQFSFSSSNSFFTLLLCYRFWVYIKRTVYVYVLTGVFAGIKS